MKHLEPVTVAVLVVLLSAKELIRAYDEERAGKEHLRVLNILIALLLVVFCAMVTRAILTAASG